MKKETENIDAIEAYFRAGCKPACKTRYGVEVEHFVVRRKDGRSVTYYEKGGVRELLEGVSSLFPEKIYSGESLLGLMCPDYSITLEPAGQLEISIAPREDCRQVKQIYEAFLHRMEPVLSALGLKLAACGYQPVSKAGELPLIPKKRYEYMDAYFQKLGPYGRYMMRGTASVQISIDYEDEQDFLLCYRAACALGPVLAFLTDYAPVFEGKPNKIPMLRTFIWEQVDSARTGIVPGTFEEGFGFRRYAQYLYSREPIFIIQNGDSVPTGNLTAAQLYQDKNITREEIEHLISMVFPDVRLKNFIEIRLADSMPEKEMLSYLVLIKGLFENREGLKQLLESCGELSEKAVKEAKEALMKNGAKAVIYEKPAAVFIREILAAAGMKQEAGMSLYKEERVCVL